MRLGIASFLAAVVGALGLGAEAQAPARPPAVVRQDAEFRHRVGAELRRLHRVQERLRRAIAHGVPWAPIPHLAVIAACESGANPRAVSPGGRYRGAYQFDMVTWRAVGGTGDPAAAPFPEQSYRAWLLYQRRGAQPWPVCGR